jgi:plasmid segregation protein ParM
MGIGMLTNQYDSPNGKKLVVQTGLPPAYLKTDTPLLKEALAGHHDFSIRIGGKQWISLKYDLKEENIYVMPQPMGTLLSISTDNTGKSIPEASKYFKSSMLIFDPGFGTLDVFNIRNKMIESSETFDNLGMKRVLQETSDRIMEKFNQEVSVPAMQKLLTTGEVKCFDRKNRRTSLESFGDLLEESNKKVCYEALQKVDNIYNNLFDHDYLVITGGTGDAWKNIITEYYSGMESLKIINGNQNDMLPTIFSNVRGYYLYIVNKMKRQTGNL